jgi:hypothetical protein
MHPMFNVSREEFVHRPEFLSNRNPFVGVLVNTA